MLCKVPCSCVLGTRLVEHRDAMQGTMLCKVPRLVEHRDAMQGTMFVYWALDW